MLSGLASVSGAVAAIAVFAAILGWQCSSAYFSEMGAGWITPLLSSVQRLSAAQTPITIFVIALLQWIWTIRQFGHASKKIKYEENLVFVLWLVGLLLYFGPAARGGSFSRVVAVGGFVTVGCWAWVVALGVARLLERDGSRFDSSEARAWIVYTIILGGFVSIPNIWGAMRAQADMTEQLTSLPEAKGAALVGEWHCVAFLGADAAIVKFPVQERRAEIRVVHLTDLTTIQMRAR